MRDKQKLLRVWELAEESLQAWCHTNGVYDWADIRAALDGVEVSATED